MADGSCVTEERCPESDGRLTDPCSHCYLHPDATDGPCKNNSSGYCANQGNTHTCSLTSGEYTGLCRPTGNFEETVNFIDILNLSIK